MRTYTTILAVAVAGLAASSAMAQTGIRNSKHNFTAYAWSGQEICRPCHIPHGGNASLAYLWNHTMSSASYTLFGGTAGGQSDIDDQSKLCMSCHDGTVALDSFGGATDGTTFISSIGTPAGTANLGTDLTNDHPIGSKAKYATTASTRFNPSSDYTQPWNGVVIKRVNNPSNTTQNANLSKMTIAGADAWVVGCRSCHNPHGTVVSGANVPKLLNFSNTGSNLCLTCHIK